MDAVDAPRGPSGPKRSPKAVVKTSTAPKKKAPVKRTPKPKAAIIEEEAPLEPTLAVVKPKVTQAQHDAFLAAESVEAQRIEAERVAAQRAFFARKGKVYTCRKPFKLNGHKIKPGDLVDVDAILRYESWVRTGYLTESAA